MMHGCSRACLKSVLNWWERLFVGAAFKSLEKGGKVVFRDGFFYLSDAEMEKLEKRLLSETGDGK